MLDFPLEIIDKIFRYVHVDSLFSFRLVSRKFYWSSRAFFNNKNRIDVLLLACKLDNVDVLKSLVKEKFNSIAQRLYDVAYKYNSEKVLDFLLIECNMRFYVDQHYRLNTHCDNSYYSYDENKYKISEILCSKAYINIRKQYDGRRDDFYCEY